MNTDSNSSSWVRQHAMQLRTGKVPAQTNPATAARNKKHHEILEALKVTQAKLQLLQDGHETQDEAEVEKTLEQLKRFFVPIDRNKTKLCSK